MLTTPSRYYTYTYTYRFTKITKAHINYIQIRNSNLTRPVLLRDDHIRGINVHLCDPSNE